MVTHPLALAGIIVALWLLACARVSTGKESGRYGLIGVVLMALSLAAMGDEITAHPQESATVLCTVLFLVLFLDFATAYARYFDARDAESIARPKPADQTRG